MICNLEDSMSLRHPVRCLLIRKSPANPCHNRYLIWVLYAQRTHKASSHWVVPTNLKSLSGTHELEYARTHTHTYTQKGQTWIAVLSPVAGDCAASGQCRPIQFNQCYPCSIVYKFASFLLVQHTLLNRVSHEFIVGDQRSPPPPNPSRCPQILKSSNAAISRFWRFWGMKLSFVAKESPKVQILYQWE